MCDHVLTSNQYSLAIMKVTIVLVLTVAALAASAPAIPSDQPVQLVVMTTKALKALGVHFPNQHQTEGTSEEVGTVNSPVDSSASQKYQQLHHKIRHSRRRYSGFRCPRGMKKDGHGKCRRVWAFYHR